MALGWSFGDVSDSVEKKDEPQANSTRDLKRETILVKKMILDLDH